MSNMTNNKNPNEIFSHPWRGILVLSIFLIVSPPMEMLVLAYFDHQWIGGRQLLIEITDVFKNGFMPNLMASYSLFMAQAVLAGLWCAYIVAKGSALTLGTAITSLVVLGFGMEAIIQIILLFNGVAFDWMRLLITIVQGIFAGFICWSIARKLKLTYNTDEVAD